MWSFLLQAKYGLTKNAYLVQSNYMIRRSTVTHLQFKLKKRCVCFFTRQNSIMKYSMTAGVLIQSDILYIWLQIQCCCLCFDCAWLLFLLSIIVCCFLFLIYLIPESSKKKKKGQTPSLATVMGLVSTKRQGVTRQVKRLQGRLGPGKSKATVKDKRIKSAVGKATKISLNFNWTRGLFRDLMRR